MDSTWKHDCDDCVLMGTLYAEAKRCDAYYHPINKGQCDFTLVVRYGDDGPDYWSGLTHSEVLVEALHMAIRRGYIVGLQEVEA